MLAIGSLNLAIILKIQVVFDIRQKLNTKTAEPYFLREGKVGKILIVSKLFS
jgi:hypothetical protein